MADDDERRLRDESAIRALTAYYSDAVTHLDAARAASIYADDGCVSIGGAELHGRAAIEAGMRQSFAAFDLLQLIEHGGVIEVAGDAARARWSTIELTIKRGAKDLNVIFGRYEDALARSAAGWRFTRRSFTMAGRTQIETTKTQLDPAFFGALAANWPAPL
jgi:ketosteroid isomerase-like protein